VLGLMSGTSADGVDAALVDVRGTGHDLRITLKAFRMFPFPTAFRERLLQAMTAGTVEDVCHLNGALGEWFARAALKVLKAADMPPSRVSVIGSHGQTLHHLPKPRRESIIGLVRSTLQLGAPAVIAERTGITTVADFRSRDMAAGGEGAPLTPYLHYLLFRHPSRGRAVVNIGGISNLTYLPAGGSLHAVRAFDTGPGNMVIDGVVRSVTGGRHQFDHSGRLARAGKVDEGLLRRLLQHPFLRRRPPKSTGREEFGERFVDRLVLLGRLAGLSDADLVATATAYTVQTIADARKFLPRRVEEVFICGGGARNPTLMRKLQEMWSGTPVRTVEALGWDGRALEAMAFAVFAYQHVQGVPCNLPHVTGAKRAVVLGTIIPAHPRRLRTRPPRA
ncbi:MAG TPA: anhydro-N-acetylmuramic acid kinase, partial [Nitrospirales bacterium]|nr:anhydro-N-acetylmuramic acid kinase [Nitrospirales bacterium]